MLFATLESTRLWLRNLADAYFHRLYFAFDTSRQISLREIADGLHECANDFHFVTQPAKP